MNGDSGLSSHNNSTEIISIIGKLNRHSMKEDAGRFDSQSNIIDCNQKTKNTFHSVNSLNTNPTLNTIDNINATSTVAQGNSLNGLPPVSGLAGRFISPRANSEVNPQLFYSQPKRQDNNQKKVSRVASDHMQSRKSYPYATNNHQNMNPNLLLCMQSNSANLLTQQEQFTTVDRTEHRSLTTKLNPKVILHKRSSVDSKSKLELEGEICLSRPLVNEKLVSNELKSKESEIIKDLNKSDSINCSSSNKLDLCNQNLIQNTDSKPCFEVQRAANQIPSPNKPTVCLNQTIDTQQMARSSPPKALINDTQQTTRPSPPKPSTNSSEITQQHLSTNVTPKKVFMTLPSASAIDDITTVCTPNFKISPKYETNKINISNIVAVSNDHAPPKEQKLNAQLVEKIKVIQLLYFVLLTNQ